MHSRRNLAILFFTMVVVMIWFGMKFDIHISLPFLSGSVKFLASFCIKFNWLRKPVQSRSGQHVPQPLV